MIFDVIEQLRKRHLGWMTLAELKEANLRLAAENARGPPQLSVDTVRRLQEAAKRRRAP